MLVRPEAIILEKDKNIFKKRFFVISGNEETLMKKIEYKLILKLKEEGFKSIEKNESKNIDSNVNLSNSENLFGESKTLIFYSPKNIDFEYIKSSELLNTAIIVFQSGLKKNSKTIQEAEKNKFVVVNCYKLDRGTKKIYLDNFINSKQLTIRQDCYWYFLENTSDLYQLFENEMLKLYSIYDEKISLDTIRLMLSNYNNFEIEKLFFLSTRGSKEIILKTSQLIQSVSDGVLMLQKIKFFLNLLSTSNNIVEAEKSFPKYLFKERDVYLTIFKKLNDERLFKIFELIKKAELALRKNSGLYLPISQRFLINLAKNLK